MNTYYLKDYESPMGIIHLASDGDKLTGLWFLKHKYQEDHLSKKIVVNDSDNIPARMVFNEFSTWLDDYFCGKKPEIPYDRLLPDGSSFQKEVWDILCTIGYGEIMTYGDIAKQIANNHGIARMSAQAVGGAVGHNPISIIIPCHRVVGANGSLTGYGGGIGRKVELLSREGYDMSRFTIPTKGTAL